jgi:hypothetical protein
MRLRRTIRAIALFEATKGTLVLLTGLQMLRQRTAADGAGY